MTQPRSAPQPQAAPPTAAASPFPRLPPTQSQQPAPQQQQQPSQPEAEVVPEPPLAGDNVMNVVFVGAECAPWSKTGAPPRPPSPLVCRAHAKLLGVLLLRRSRLRGQAARADCQEDCRSEGQTSQIRLCS